MDEPEIKTDTPEQAILYCLFQLSVAIEMQARGQRPDELPIALWNLQEVQATARKFVPGLQDPVRP